jgi:hypothetical protein
MLENHIDFLQVVAFQMWSERSAKHGLPLTNTGKERLIDMRLSLSSLIPGFDLQFWGSEHEAICSANPQ